MEKVALMTLDQDKVVVTITNNELASAEQCVYAWKTGDGLWVRVGSSMHKLGKRLLIHQPHINRSLEGNHKPTPKEQADKWVELLKKHGKIIAFGHQPPFVKTLVGEIRPYLDIERHLIREHRPLLNKSHR